MAKIERNRDGIALHPREDNTAVGILAAVNSEVTLNLDGESTLAIDLRPSGATGAPSFVLEGTIDGTNYEAIPVYSRITQLWAINTLPSISVGTTFVADVTAYRGVRLRTFVAPSAGNYSVNLRASLADFVSLALPMSATPFPSLTAAAGAVVSFTTGAPGAGLFVYLTHLSIQRFATAALTAAAAPILIPVAGVAGSVNILAPAEAALQGTLWEKELPLSQPLRASATNTAITVTCPATPSVIWRVNAVGYVAS